MNFKHVGLGLAATAAMTAGAALIEAPAYALSFGQVDFAWNANISPGSTIDFFGFDNSPNPGVDGDILVTSRTGDFLEIPVNPGSPPIGLGKIKDLIGPTAIPFVGTLPNFIVFNGADPKFNFTLTSFVQSSSNLYQFTGIFGDGSIGQGRLSDQEGLSYSGTITVPTPALLPGLIGMGLAALRKRKGEAEHPEEIKA